MTGTVQRLNPRLTMCGNILVQRDCNFCDSHTDSACPQQLGTFGNTPHSLCCGPALSNTDLVIAKKTPLTKSSTRNSARSFITPGITREFENPDGNFSDSTFGKVLKARDPRVMQFAIKFLF